MSTQLHTYLKTKVDGALDKAVKRVADLRFFQQILARLQAGEDMTKQLAAFKAVDDATALATVRGLIERCEKDLAAGYWAYDGFSKIKTTVTSTYNGAEAVPRYAVQYEIKTKHGIVVANIKTSGATFEVKYDTKQCPNVTKDEALDTASNQLMLAALA